MFMTPSDFFYTHALFVFCCITILSHGSSIDDHSLDFTFIMSVTIYYGKDNALVMSCFIIVSGMGWFTS